MAVVTFSHRHIALALGILLTACHGQQPVVPPAPESLHPPVEEFLSAANANDLVRMNAVWGDEHGPMHRGPETARTQRLTIMQRLLHGDSHEVVATDVSDPRRPKVSVAIMQGTRRFVVPFTLVRSDRGWMIVEIGLDAAMPASGSAPR